MTALLDVNVLIALAWPNHIHHAAAREWFETYAGQGWATCSITQAGFIRVSSNSTVMPEARTPAEAAHLLGLYTARPDHTFLVDDLELVNAMHGVFGFRQVTDSHLLQLAQRHQARFATFDSGVAELSRAMGSDVDLLSW